MGHNCSATTRTQVAPSDVSGLIGFENRFDRIDSNYALDGDPSCRDNGTMKDTDDVVADRLQMLVLERRDPSCNMARFYVLAIEPTLFGDAALVREWGRIGCLGRRRLDLHPDKVIAEEALHVWLDRKMRRGYRVQASHVQS